MKPWFRLNADYPLDGAVRETGFAWAWSFLLAAWKRSSVFGRLSDTDLSDRVLHEVAQVAGCPAGRSFTIRDAYISVGLIVPHEDGGWTTPSWEDYQEDPTKSLRQQRFRDANRERLAEAKRRSRDAGRRGTTRDDVATRRDSEEATRDDVVTEPERRGTTRDDARRDGTGRDVDPQVIDQPDPLINTNQGPASGQTDLGAGSPAGDEPDLPPALRAQAVEVFRHWVTRMGKNGAASKLASQASRKRVGHVVARLRDGYTVEQLKAAIEGCARSPFHQGQNERGAIYDDLELICRADKVDRFIRDAAQPAGPPRTSQPPAPGAPPRRGPGPTDPIPSRERMAEIRAFQEQQRRAAGGGGGP